MKDVIVMICLVVSLIGFIMNYNTEALRLGTNLITFGFIGIILVGVFNSFKSNKDDKSKK